MSKAKKVIFVIVEGPTDKDALSSVLKQIFSSAEVHFHVIRGDITTDVQDFLLPKNGFEIFTNSQTVFGKSVDKRSNYLLL